MKKILAIAAIFILTGFVAGTSALFAQMYATSGITTIKAGYFDPSASQAGFIFGGVYSFRVDESVDVGVAVDYFRKTHWHRSVNEPRP